MLPWANIVFWTAIAVFVVVANWALSERGALASLCELRTPGWCVLVLSAVFIGLGIASL